MHYTSIIIIQKINTFVIIFSASKLTDFAKIDTVFTTSEIFSLTSDTMESEVNILYKIILGVDFMKKLLATILVVIMIFSLTMVAVNATESEYNFEDNLISLTVRDTRYEESLEK